MQAPSSKLPPSPHLSHHYGNPASSVPGTESPWSWETPQSKADWDTLFAIILLSRQGQNPFPFQLKFKRDRLEIFKGNNTIILLADKNEITRITKHKNSHRRVIF